MAWYNLSKQIKCTLPITEHDQTFPEMHLIKIEVNRPRKYTQIIARKLIDQLEHSNVIKYVWNPPIIELDLCFPVMHLLTKFDLLFGNY